jgi:L-ascorbate metabolism protein UlaG (beta-lactamase superfamily)
MKIRFIGQSCFAFQTENGTRIVTDPFHSDIGYKMPKLSADIVSTSHDHFDHNNIGKIQGDFDHFNQPGDFESHGVKIRGIASFHDDEEGKKRGKNVIFRFEADGLALCHLGDLGHLPDARQLELMGKVDVLFLPVGEVFTFEVKDALKTVDLIKPAVVVLMHYKTKRLSIGLETERKFLKLAGASKKIENGEMDVTPETLSDYAGVVVLEPQA